MIRSITYFVDAGLHVRDGNDKLIKTPFLANNYDGEGMVRMFNALPIHPAMELKAHLTGGHIMSAIDWLKGLPDQSAVHWQIKDQIVVAKSAVLGTALAMLGDSVDFVLSVSKVEKEDYDDFFTATVHYKGA